MGKYTAQIKLHDDEKESITGTFEARNDLEAMLKAATKATGQNSMKSFIEEYEIVPAGKITIDDMVVYFDDQDISSENVVSWIKNPAGKVIYDIGLYGNAKPLQWNIKEKTLRKYIREQIKRLLVKEADTTEKDEDSALTSLQKKIDDLNKATKKVPYELKNKLANKIKKAQAELDDYIAPEKEEK